MTIASTCATAREFNGSDTRVVPFGVEHDRVRDDIARDASFSALFVGQLRPYKGVDVLLRAMADLPDVQLTIAGRGYAEPALRRLATERHLADVTFAGSPADDALWELYARSHLFVQPSTEMEYFGLASLEAMASGCVPVITGLPGPVEVVDGAGRIVPPGDVRALAQAIVVKLYKLYSRNLGFRLYRRAFIEENKWRAARWGIDGKLIDFGKRAEVPMRQLAVELLEFIDDVVDELESREAVEYVHTVLREGTSADQQLAVFRETGDLRAVVRHIVTETRAGVDRRGEARV